MNISSCTEPQVVRPSSSVLHFAAPILRAAILPLAILSVTAAFAQGPYAAPNAPLLSPAAVSAMESTSATSALPEDPGARLAAPPVSAISPQFSPQNATRASAVAPRYSMTISAGLQARPWSAHDKFIGGLLDVVSPLSLAGDLLSAGYSDLTNGQPNYGTNGKAIGKRIGATVLRDSTETFFSESIMAPVLHEDPRYYVEGPRHNIVHRTLYAITRPIITRTDGGHSTLNGAVLVGYAAGSALSYTYYPEINKNFKDTAATFGGSLAGAAIGDFVSEFIDDTLQALHLEKKP
jgi:hypothetical protein